MGATKSVTKVVGILGILAIIVILAMSSTLRWRLIGIALIAGGVYISTKVKFRQDKSKIIVLMAFLIPGLILLLSAGILQEQISSNVFVNPDWARLECSPTDAYEGMSYNTLNNQLIYKCNANTEECRVMIEHTTQGTFVSNLRTNYRTCNLDGTGCTSWESLALDDGTKLSYYIPLKVGKQLQFIEDGIDEIGYKYGKVTVEWKDWKIYRFVGGAKFEVVSDSCKLPISSFSKIPDGENPASGVLSRTGGEGDKWINYVNAWNYGPATNVFTHPQYGEVYCNAAQIFDIVELKMEDGSLKKLDPSYSETREDGVRISGQGKKLANVECCPNEPNCGNDFKFIPVEDVSDKECFTDSQCLNAGGPVPISGNEYVLYQCIDSQCVKSEPIEVECTNSAQCPSGQICDLSTTNYGKCTEPKGGEYCGDDICQNSENAETCPSDCGESQCEWWESYYETEGIFRDKKGCATSGWVYGSIAGLIILILGIIALILYRPKKKKGKSKSKGK